MLGVGRGVGVLAGVCRIVSEATPSVSPAPDTRPRQGHTRLGKLLAGDASTFLPRELISLPCHGTLPWHNGALCSTRTHDNFPLSSDRTRFSSQ